MWRAASVALVLVMLGACGGNDGDAATVATPTPASSTATSIAACAGSSATSGSSPTSAAAPKESAEAALKRQMNMLADGQGQRAYAELHPAQQALFTVQQYADCVRSAGSLDITGFKVKDIYQESLAIPGTDLTVDSTAVTAELTTNLGTDTDTFHEVAVGGEWRFTVTDVDNIVAGTCA
jgi:hypothetical protein